MLDPVSDFAAQVMHVVASKPSRSAKWLVAIGSGRWFVKKWQKSGLFRDKVVWSLSIIL